MKAKLKILIDKSQVAHLINAQPDEIIFTSGGTEADNMAILSVASFLYAKKGLKLAPLVLVADKNEKIEGESLLLSLDLKGIAASSGSACTLQTPVTRRPTSFKNALLEFSRRRKSTENALDESGELLVK